VDPSHLEVVLEWMPVVGQIRTSQNIVWISLPKAGVVKGIAHRETMLAAFFCKN